MSKHEVIFLSFAIIKGDLLKKLEKLQNHYKLWNFGYNILFLFVIFDFPKL